MEKQARTHQVFMGLRHPHDHWDRACTAFAPARTGVSHPNCELPDVPDRTDHATAPGARPECRGRLRRLDVPEGRRGLRVGAGRGIVVISSLLTVRPLGDARQRHPLFVPGAIVEALGSKGANRDAAMQ